MDTRKFKEMKLSQLLKIEAETALRFERVGTEPDLSTGLQSSEVENRWVLAVGISSAITAQDMTSLEREFPGFSICVTGGKGKKGVFVKLEAEQEKFLQLIRLERPANTSLSTTPNFR